MYSGFSAGIFAGFYNPAPPWALPTILLQIAFAVILLPVAYGCLSKSRRAYLVGSLVSLGMLLSLLLEASILPFGDLSVATVLAALATMGDATGLEATKMIGPRSHRLRNLGIILLVISGSILGIGVYYSSSSSCLGCGFTTGPIVRITPISCANSTGVCMLRLNNSGTASVEAIECGFVNETGSMGPGVLSPSSVTLLAPGSAVVTCTDPNGRGGGVGSQVVGGVMFNNGVEPEWTATWEYP